MIPILACTLGVVVLIVNRLLASLPSIVVEPVMFRIDPDVRYSVSLIPPTTCLMKFVTLFTPLST